MNTRIHFHNLGFLMLWMMMLEALIPLRINGQVQDSPGTGLPYSLWLDPEDDRFTAIRQNVETWFEGRDKGRGSGYVQWKRWEYFNEHRLTADGSIANHAARNWEAYEEYKSNTSSRGLLATHGSWYSLNIRAWSNAGSGYNPGLGRVNCIAFHPTDPNILWIGLPSGGLWKTLDHGSTWVPLTDGLPSIGISGIVVDPLNTNVIYVLTGDGDAGDTKTIGVLKSYNGGLTWYSTGLSYNVTDDQTGFKLIRHPTDNNTLWAVMTNGLWQTTNGGVNWNCRLTGSFRDLEFKPGTPSTIYVSTTNRFYRSADHGFTWTEIISGLPTGESRIAIGVTPAMSGYVYVLCGPGGCDGDGTFKGLYLSTDSGLNFSLKSNTPNVLGNDKTGGGSEDQSGYDLALAVNRIDYGVIMCGGINNWRSSNYGNSWVISSHWKITDLPSGVDYVHADIHALEINPLNDRLYCGCDGGIFWSDHFGDDWYDISAGLDPMQWYRIAGYDPNTDLIIGGTQDNGSNKYSGSTTISHILGADGMDCAIDHTQPNTIYISQQFGAFFKSTDGGNNFSPIKPAGITGTWVTPLLMDPNNANTLYAGYDDVYRTTDGGANWTNLQASGTRALAMSRSNTSVIYAATDYLLYRTGNGGTNWTVISVGLPANQIITGIAVDAQDANEVWVVLDRFIDGQKVYHTSNAAAASVVWENITGTLPNTVMNCIVTDDGLGTDDVLYVGTDIGVFYRDATLSDWVPFSNWLPVVRVLDLELNNNQDVITAGTYGRGLWRSATYSACETSWNFTGNAPPGYSYYEASDFIISTKIFNQGAGQEGIHKAGNFIRLNPGFSVSGESKFKAVLGPCGGGVPGFDQSGPTGTYAGPMPETENK